MIGIVVVSHSRALADAVVELATQMTPDDGPTVSVAAGADGGLGTDATAVAEALAEAASPDGVLVLMDLGSAVMSAELAIELADLDGVEVRLSPAPLVEGLVAAVVRAAGGADLATVAREAESALKPKQSALGEPAAAGPSERGRQRRAAGRVGHAHADQSHRAARPSGGPAGHRARPARRGGRGRRERAGG